MRYGKSPCEICGMPGDPVGHPAAPVTVGVRCADHAADMSAFNPIPLLFWLVVLGVAAGAWWLIGWLRQA